MKFYANPISPQDASGELKELYNEIEEMFGKVPLHIQLHATYAFEDMKCFIEPMKMTRNHPEIPLEWFALMRLYVAKKDNYPYCISLNTKMLNNLGVNNNTIEAFLQDINKAPLSKELILLLKKALKSIYNSHNFNSKDFEELYKAGFSDKLIYQIIHYSTQFSGIAKRLNTYLAKEDI